MFKNSSNLIIYQVFNYLNIHVWTKDITELIFVLLLSKRNVTV